MTLPEKEEDYIHRVGRVGRAEVTSCKLDNKARYNLQVTSCKSRATTYKSPAASHELQVTSWALRVASDESRFTSYKGELHARAGRTGRAEVMGLITN